MMPATTRKRKNVLWGHPVPKTVYNKFRSRVTHDLTLYEANTQVYNTALVPGVERELEDVFQDRNFLKLSLDKVDIQKEGVHRMVHGVFPTTQKKKEVQHAVIMLAAKLTASTLRKVKAYEVVAALFYLFATGKHQLQVTEE